MFQFTRFASHDYVFIMRYPCGWVSPFRNLRIKAYLPAPRSLSQAITSFIACNRQGIHHMLLVTWPYNFDVSCESISVVSKTVWGLTPHALCRNVNDSFCFHWFLSDCLENDSSLLKFNKVKFVLTQSKMLLAARSVLNLYECTVSANNSDFDSMNF